MINPNMEFSVVETPNIKNGYQELIIIRGLPGSGKSTYGESFNEKHWDHFEADMFFVDKDDDYVFIKDHIKKAHEWCYLQTFQKLLAGRSVIVSNTFTEYWEAKRYIDLAIEFGVGLSIVTLDNDFDSIHNVPVETLNKMKERFVPHEQFVENCFNYIDNLSD